MSAAIAVSLAAFVRGRPALDRERFISYWRDVHGTLAARVPDSQLYRIHVLDPASPLLLGLPEGVEGTAGEGECFDGIAELRWSAAADLERWSVSPALTEFVAEDEQNVFGYCAVYWARGDNVVEAKDEIPEMVVDGPQVLPTVIVAARRAAGAGRDALGAYLRDTLVPAFAAEPGVVRATLHLLDPYGGEWDSPNVGHEGEGDFEAWVELTFAGFDACGAALGAAPVRSALAASSGTAGALHAYLERETYTLRRGGAPTLVGLRGYQAARTMLAIGARNQLRPEVLKVSAGTSGGVGR